jgi:ribose transport system permease protein
VSVAPAPPPPATAAERLRTAQRILVDHPEVFLVAILVALFLGTNLYGSGTITGDQVTTTLLAAAPLGILAAGQTLVMLTAGIDLSVAVVATAGAYMMAERSSTGAAWSILAGLLVGFLVGLVNGIGVGIFRVNPLIMTLGMAGITAGGLVVYAQESQGLPTVPSAVRTLGSDTVLGNIPVNLVLWVPLALLIILGLRLSGFGRMIYAIGDNPVACRLAGVRVWQVQIAVYTICGVLSAMAGILLAGLNDAADLELANALLLPCIAAVVIGGTSIFGGVGGYTGTILGALILTVLDNLLTLTDTSQAVRQIIYGSIVLGLAWLYSRLSRANE